MEQYKIGTEKITFYGKAKGSNTNKFNRVNKLAKDYNALYSKLIGMVERGSNSCTENYRCAVATLLLMETGIRVGNETSAEGYNTVPHPHAKVQESKFVQTYGLTTLKREHVKSRNGNVMFDFSGKKQVRNTFNVPSTLSKYVKQLAKCGNEPVFGITDYQLTKFIKVYVGKQFSPKDFRTLRANIYAEQLAEKINWEDMKLKKDIRKGIKSVYEGVAEKLNNTPGVCKKNYINELVFEGLIN